LSPKARCDCQIPNWRQPGGSYEKIGRLACARARELGFGTDHFSLRDYPETALERILKARNIRGLILLAPNWNEPVPRFQWEHYAAITVGWQCQDPPLDASLSHDWHRVQIAVLKAIEAGYDRIGLALFRSSSSLLGQAHIGGYYSALIQKGVTPEISVCLSEWKGDHFLQWFETHRPDVVISFSRTFYDRLNPSSAVTESDFR